MFYNVFNLFAAKNSASGMLFKEQASGMNVIPAQVTFCGTFCGLWDLNPLKVLFRNLVISANIASSW